VNLHTQTLEVNTLSWMVDIPYCHCCWCSVADD